MSEGCPRRLLHLLLLLFVALSAGSALTVYGGMFFVGILLLVAALVFLATLVACLLFPLFTQRI